MPEHAQTNRETMRPDDITPRELEQSRRAYFDGSGGVADALVAQNGLRDERLANSVRDAERERAIDRAFDAVWDNVPVSLSEDELRDLLADAIHGSGQQ